MAGASPAIDSISRQQNAALALGNRHTFGQMIFGYMMLRSFLDTYMSKVVMSWRKTITETIPEVRKGSFKTLKKGTRAQPKVILFSLRL